MYYYLLPKSSKITNVNNRSKLTPLEHYFLSYDFFKKKSGKILDFGCGDGTFIAGLQGNSKKLYGIDVREDSIKEAKNNYKKINFKTIKVGGRIPYSNNFFDAVCMFHVLEHVDSEGRVLKEIFRVLKPNGYLLLASPYHGLFTWADTANIRYRFPRAHRLFMNTFLGRDEYEKRFINRKIKKLFGDSSLNRDWHKHYKEKDIKKLLKNDFEIEKFLKFSLFHPFLLVVYNIWHYVFKKHNKFLTWLVRLDNQLKLGEFSYNMLVIARKNEQK